MPNEIRVRANGIGGLIEDNPLTAVATVLTSAGLAACPVIGTTQHLAIVLDPDGLNGGPEIAYVTAHVAAATTATILRGQEGTVARAHDRDVPWVHAATIQDFPKMGVSKPAANVTRNNTVLGPLSTPFTVSVEALAGQRVVIRASVVASAAADAITYMALAKGGAVLTKCGKNYNGGEPRTTTTVLEWVDEAPAVGINTYEVYVAGGTTVTVMGGNAQDTSTALGMNGNSVLTATAMP